jgi:hypothetical protein
MSTLETREYQPHDELIRTEGKRQYCPFCCAESVWMRQEVEKENQKFIRNAKLGRERREEEEKEKLLGELK